MAVLIELLLPAASLLEAQGRLHLAEDHAEQALADFLEAGHRFGRAGIRNPALTAWRAGGALAALALGAQQQAQDLADEQLELARAFGSPRLIGVSLRTAALCGTPSDTIALLREAEAALNGTPATLEHARTLVELGAALRRRNHRLEAREPLRRGMELAGRCGAAPLVARAQSELAATGARPRRRMTLTGAAALTASERRVAELAANGHSNPDIAQALFVTRRTVETHLTSAYRKLEITSRTQLADALRS